MRRNLGFLLKGPSMHGKLKDGEGVSFHGGCGFTCHSRFVVRSPPVPSLSSGSRDDEDTAEPARRSKDDTHRRQEQQPSPLAPTPPASTPPTRSPQPAPRQAPGPALGCRADRPRPAEGDGAAPGAGAAQARSGERRHATAFYARRWSVGAGNGPRD